MVLNVIQGQMENLEELLPGIEEYICTVLANEKLSSVAEEKRLYYVERLDILKLPPSVPPRPNILRDEVLVEVHEVLSRKPSQESILEAVEEPDDFAAYQREISRALIIEDTEPQVKVYDDIDLGRDESVENLSEDEDQGLYEIPVVARAQTSTDDSKLPSADQLDPKPTASESKSEGDTEASKPPPLPPRRERSASDAPSLVSVGSNKDERPELPARSAPPRTDKDDKTDSKSMKSEDLNDTDDGTGTSYESYDDEEKKRDKDLLNKLNIKLPKTLKRSKKHKKLTASRSSTLWEDTVPYSSLQHVTLSGELYYKGKLSWSRKLIALSNGNLVCYKPEKVDSKPAIVIALTGCEVIFRKRENHKGYIINLSHKNGEAQVFSVDFKEWAQMWCDYITAMSEEKTPPGQYHHLARTHTLAGDEELAELGIQSELGASNLSLASSEGVLDSSTLTRRGDKNRNSKMGTFAYRATQFFETLSKKPGKKIVTSVSSVDSLKDKVERQVSNSSSTPNFSSTSAPPTPLFPPADSPFTPADSPFTETYIKHKGYLNIFSSFNKRKWGKRWCLVNESMFECYRTETSEICELEFLLRNCILQRAVEQTKSDLGLILLENNVEKITVEPLTPEDMCGWLRVLVTETQGKKVPEGLEEFWVEEAPYDDIDTADSKGAKFSDHQGYSTIEMEVSPSKSDLEGDPHYYLGSGSDTDLNNTVEMRSMQHSPSQNTADSGKYSGESMDSATGGSADMHIAGHAGGELYTQVQKKSVSRDSMQERTSAIELTETNILNLKSEGDDCFGSEVFHNVDTEGSLVSELLTQFDKKFSQDSDEDSDSDFKADTAYSSGCSARDSKDVEEDLDKSHALCSPLDETVVMDLEGDHNNVSCDNTVTYDETSDVSELVFSGNDLKSDENSNLSFSNSLLRTDESANHSKNNSPTSKTLGCEEVKSTAVDTVSECEKCMDTDTSNTNLQVDLSCGTQKTGDFTHAEQKMISTQNEHGSDLQHSFTSICEQVTISQNTLESSVFSGIVEDQKEIEETKNVIKNCDSADQTEVHQQSNCVENVEQTKLQEMSAESFCDSDVDITSMSDIRKRIDKLRTRLVGLKENRIKIRDMKLQAESEDKRLEFQDQISDLDRQCHQTTDTICYLECQLHNLEEEEMLDNSVIEV